MTVPRHSLFLPTGGKQRADVWHVKFRHQGKQVMRSTGEKLRALAELRAIEIVRAVVDPPADGIPFLSEAERLGSSIAQIVAVYLEMDEPSESTRSQNVRDLCRLVETRFRVERVAAMRLPSGVLNAATVDAFVRERQGVGRIRRDRVLGPNRSINSFINHAKGVFSARAMARYQARGLSVPDAIAELTGYAPLPDGRRPQPSRLFRGDDAVVRVWVDADGVVRWEGSRINVIADTPSSGHWVKEG